MFDKVEVESYLAVDCHIYFSLKNTLETRSGLMLQGTAGHAETEEDHMRPAGNISN